MQRQHLYRGVTGLGHVAVSRHAQDKMDREGISQELFERVLLNPLKPDVQEDLARAGKCPPRHHQPDARHGRQARQNGVPD